MLHFIQYTIIGIIWLMLVIVIVQFLIEKERYAVRQTLKILVLYSAIILVHFIFHIDLIWLASLLVIIGSFVIITLFIPFQFREVQLKFDKGKVDERTTIFSRMFELKNEGEKKKSFYDEYPEGKQVDEKLRSLPGLLSPDALYYDPKYFSKAHEYDKKLAKLFPLIEGIPDPYISKLSISQIENQIVARAKKIGAVSVGFTKLNETHFYSKKGRGKRYGEPIKSDHEYAIAFTVEMDKDAVAKAPKAPVIAESIKQYYRSAKIATSIAEYLRSVGYEATAHIDANYEVICPLVARDAGLGDIGRMGLLMTPELGPRVRISVVTTTLKLSTSKTKFSNSVQYFCRICKKCAYACPSKAIQKGDMVTNGKVRYKINHEKCYGYWAKVGTDCARCMSVCPYSHPNNWFHNIIRFGINQNPFFARIALIADHYFYGKIPKIKN